MCHCKQLDFKIQLVESLFTLFTTIQEKKTYLKATHQITPCLDSQSGILLGEQEQKIQSLVLRDGVLYAQSTVEKKLLFIAAKSAIWDFA